MKKRLRFTLSTLLIAVALVAIGTFLWLRFLAPNITGISVKDGNVVFHLSDEAGREMFPQDPYSSALAAEPEAMFHDTYIAVPAYVVISSLALACAFVVAVRLTWTKLARRMSRHANVV